MEKKISTPVELLCKGFPEELKNFLNYTRELRFDDRPDYAFLKKLINSVVIREKIDVDFIFDWVLRKQELDKIKEEKGESNENNENYKKGSMLQNKTSDNVEMNNNINTGNNISNFANF